MLTGLVFLVLAHGGVAQKPAWPGSCKSSDRADEVLASVPGVNLSGKVVVLTGGDGNIATEVGFSLAKRGALMILGCRKVDKCEPLRQRIIESGEANFPPEIEQLDLSSKDNINAFAQRVMAKHSKLHALINSAGVYFTTLTPDGLVSAMEVNVIGPALLSHLLLPVLRGGEGREVGRVVNVAAVSFGKGINMTVDQLRAITTKEDPTVSYYSLSKDLMVHHAKELAKREPNVAAFALAPGVVILTVEQGRMFPDWMKHAISHGGMALPDWLRNLLPKGVERYIKACGTNEAGLASCPQSMDQGAGVTCAAVAWPNIESYSGSYLDYETLALADTDEYVYGPWTQNDPTCTPRDTFVPMDESVRAGWYDEMLRLMGVGAHDISV